MTSITNQSWNYDNPVASEVTSPGYTHHALVHSDIDTKADHVIGAANTKQFEIFLPSFIFICVLLVVGLPGNILALVIYHKKVKRAVAKNFLITMCICDTLSCAVVMPVELDIMRNFFEYDEQWLCKGFRFYAYSVSNVSSLTLIAIAVERYRIICNPWKPKFSSELSKRLCVCNIVIAILTSVPMAFIYGTQTVPLGQTDKERQQHDNSSGYESACNASVSVHKQAKTYRQTTTPVLGKACLMDDSMVGSSFPMYVVAVYIASIILTFLVFIYLYGHVIRKLASRRRKSMCQQNSEALGNTSNKRVKHVTIMAIILTLSYEVCYLPCLTAVCIRLAHPEFYSTLSVSGKMIFNFMLKSYLLNSALNPFIYCFCNREFRLGLWTLMRSLKITFRPSRQDSVGDTNTKTFSETVFRRV